MQSIGTIASRKVAVLLSVLAAMGGLAIGTIENHGDPGVA